MRGVPPRLQPVPQAESSQAVPRPSASVPAPGLPHEVRHQDASGSPHQRQAQEDQEVLLHPAEVPLLEARRPVVSPERQLAAAHAEEAQPGPRRRTGARICGRDHERHLKSRARVGSRRSLDDSPQAQDQESPLWVHALLGADLGSQARRCSHRVEARGLGLISQGPWQRLFPGLSAWYGHGTNRAADARGLCEAARSLLGPWRLVSANHIES
ncbi:hypothetical protein VTK73DRAFT_6204 [Phialemonium thermophilum]|uniref:Uncharacterized protein n=1 Tax=Phialemonium thermophilum TaxID=223376 RepID=A0ABR3UZV0_9PEZI